jgi:hypothetical protein
VKGNGLAVALGILGVVFVIAAILYVIGGILPTFTSSDISGPHYKHAILFAVLAVASFVGANFSRVRTV